MKATLANLILAGILFCGATISNPVIARAQNDTEKTYKANCVLCHGADGSGGTPSGKALGAKDLRSEAVQKKTDADLTAVISAGKGKMPAFAKKLSAEDIQKLVKYIKALPKSK